MKEILKRNWRGVRLLNTEWHIFVLIGSKNAKKGSFDYLVYIQADFYDCLKVYAQCWHDIFSVGGNIPLEWALYLKSLRI